MQQTSILFLFALLLICGCKKEDTPLNPYNGKTTAVFNPELSYGTVTDIDGNVYKTIVIGTQTWMAENLRTTRYFDGTLIPNLKGDDEWNSSTIGAYCSYNNTTNVDTISTFGFLYNWEAINTGKLAPQGWHVSTNKDWYVLNSFLGTKWDENGVRIEGNKLKETGTDHWSGSNTAANNSTGFTALPGGSRFWFDKPFTGLGNQGGWWGFDPDELNYAWVIYLDFNYGGVSFDGANLDNGVRGQSIRCVKDN